MADKDRPDLPQGFSLRAFRKIIEELPSVSVVHLSPDSKDDLMHPASQQNLVAEALTGKAATLAPTTATNRSMHL